MNHSLSTGGVAMLPASLPHLGDGRCANNALKLERPLNSRRTSINNRVAFGLDQFVQRKSKEDTRFARRAARESDGFDSMEYPG